MSEQPAITFEGGIFATAPADVGAPADFYALKLPESRERTRREFEHMRKAGGEIAVQCVLGLARLRDVEDTGADVWHRVEAAFLVGEHHTKAQALFAAQHAIRGRKFAPAAATKVRKKAAAQRRDTGNRRANPLRDSIEGAFEDWRELGDEGETISDFLLWLQDEAETYAIHFEKESGAFSQGNHTARGRVIYRWLNDV